MEGANAAKLTALHFTAWKLGLKTGMYYLRTKAATDATKFTVEQTPIEVNAPIPNVMMMADGNVGVISETTAQDLVCSLDNPEGCISCGS